MSETVDNTLPDRLCLTRGDEYLVLAVRCYAAAGLSDQQIKGRLALVVDGIWPGLFAAEAEGEQP